METEVEELGSKQAFKELDLYTTRPGQTLNDEIETFLFGKIDKRGADAVRAWIAGSHVQIHRSFHDFFEYMDAQKLRTPKGLDWILKHYRGLSQLELMRQMQALRQMHTTMWSECVREIVSAAKSPVKFLVSDHPVTIYHPELPSDAAECQYPSDPGVDLVGSQTIFALDENHCLILTNLEYAEDPTRVAVLSRRTNARFRGTALARTDAFIRGRELCDAEVHAINLVLKSRARKHVAASNPEWLYPERHCKLPWADIAKTLLPSRNLWRFGGEIYIGHRDGTSSYRDKFGRTSSAHEFLTKPLLKDPASDAPCGCGSGIAFGDCCAEVESHKRPSWSVMSIRERNLALVGGIKRILQLSEAMSWIDVRRNLSDDQVRRIHQVFAAMWPTDTQLIDLLPVPQSKRSRALYLGMVDARTIATKITGMLLYVDELVLVHPFINANGVRPEFSPIEHPDKFREQTLRSVFSLMLLEPYIRAGRVHLVPDPIDYDAGFRNEIMTITEQVADTTELGPIDAALAKALGHDEMMRCIKRLPPEAMKAYLKQHIPDCDSHELSDADIDSVVRLCKREMEEDPFSLFDPPPSTAEGAEFKVFKGFGRETGLFVATLTGSFIYTDSDTHWSRLHESDGIHYYESDPAAEEAISLIEDLTIEVPLTYHHQSEPAAASETRVLLRNVALELLTGKALRACPPASPEAVFPTEDKSLLTFKLSASVPLGGFQRTDVSRLVLTFGRIDDVAPVRLAVFRHTALRS